MDMRTKSSGRDLPPRMLRRKKTFASGKVWIGYYYNGRDESGRRVEIPLGTDLNEAKRRWAELDCKPAPVETGLMSVIFNRYERDVIPTKSFRTQKDNDYSLKNLRKVFDTAPIDVITPQHIEVEAGKPFKLAIRNIGSTAAEFESLRLYKEKVLAPGAESFLVFRRLSAGTYPFFEEFHMNLDSANGTITAK